MKLGYVGLGKMGTNMCERLLERKHQVVAYDPNPSAITALMAKGAGGANDLKELVGQLASPRTIWLMVPAIQVDNVLTDLYPLLSTGDVIIDGGNSQYKESARRSKELGEKGIKFLDAGVSGGPNGARNGACLMIGGDETTFKSLEPLFRDVAAEHAYAYFGQSGAGHFVKMVHNGIEYGMMQSIAEGFALMRKSPFSLDLMAIAELYNHRSVVESRLVGWLADTYRTYGQDLKDISGTVGHTGEGAWTIEAANDLGSPVPSIELAFNFRKESAEKPSYIGQILSGLRNAFGGHEAKKS